MSTTELSEQLDSLKIVSEPSQERLNQKEVIDYRSHRTNKAKWFLTLGKEPVKAHGYSPTTLKPRLSMLDRFNRFVWDETGGYTTNITHDHADEYVQEMIYSDVTDQYRANVQKALKMLFKYKAHGGGTSVEDTGLLWEPDVKFSQHQPTTVAKEYFTKKELKEVREASLSWGSPPHYNALTPKERDEWKIHLAQRYEIPKDKVGPSVFEKAQGFKIASLMCVSLDTGLRPIEVGRATTDWFDHGRNALFIPKNHNTKNTEDWEVALQESTSRILAEWLEERELYDKYDGDDHIWLTKYGNEYGAQTLARLLRRICDGDNTNIDVEQRQPTWYSIRRGVSTILANEGSIKEAQMQLRHQSAKTTMGYVQSNTDARRRTLENSF